MEVAIIMTLSPLHQKFVSPPPQKKKDCPKPIVKNLHISEPVLMVLYTKNTGTNLSDPVEIEKFGGFEHGKK